jgi:hypothetical protein
VTLFIFAEDDQFPIGQNQQMRCSYGSVKGSAQQGQQIVSNFGLPERIDHLFVRQQAASGIVPEFETWLAQAIEFLNLRLVIDATQVSVCASDLVDERREQMSRNAIEPEDRYGEPPMARDTMDSNPGIQQDTA